MLHEFYCETEIVYYGARYIPVEQEGLLLVLNKTAHGEP